MVDHKPLLPLYNNPKRPKQMRVDRHRMKLAGYRFHVSHVSGEKNPCDYGSRAGCPVKKEHTDQEKKDQAIEDDLDVYVNRVVEDQLPTAVTRKMMQRATRTDKELQKLMEDLRTGRCRNRLTRYTKVFPELTEEEGIIMRGEQIVIPRELQATVVHLAHEGHLGQDKTLGLLRETCWFPGMGDLVHKFVSTCRPCLAAVPRTRKEPLKPTMLPDGAWQQVHADYKGPIGKRCPRPARSRRGRSGWRRYTCTTRHRRRRRGGRRCSQRKRQHRGARGHPTHGHPAPRQLLAGRGGSRTKEEATAQARHGEREGLLGGEPAKGA